MATFLSIILVLMSCDCATKKRFTREPKCGDTKHFRFDEELPTYNSELSYCKYYRGETCCNKTHTDKIIQNIYAFHELSVSSDCRDISANIGCSPCDPRIGTNQMKGICKGYCDEWFHACRNDYFHFDKRGILTACSESDMVCSKLSQITNNGSKLCELSGFDVSYVSIQCYNGKKSRFKPLPKSKAWETPFSKVIQMLNASPFGKNLSLLIQRYAQMTLWQQMFVMGGFAYSLFALFKVIMNTCSYYFGEAKPEQVSKIPTDIFDHNELDKIRNKRLEKFAKETMMRNQLNMEAKLAKQLGLDEITQDLTIGNHTYTNDDNISISDDDSDIE